MTVQENGNSATCPTGTFALGGGGSIGPTGGSLVSSAPILDAEAASIGWMVQQSSGDNAGMTAYVICAESGPSTPPPPAVQALAPTNLGATIGDFDAGGQSNDARLTFTAPTGNTIDSYAIQRSFLGSTTTASATNCTLGMAAPASTDSFGSPAGSTFSTIGTATAPAGTSATFTNPNLSAGGYCYRVRTQHPVSGAPTFSNYAPANVAPPAPLLTVVQGFAIDAANTASATVPGTGQHTFTFQATGLSGTLDFALLPSANANRNTDGTYSFCDLNSDRKADGPGTGSTFFVALNGSAITASPVLINVPIPSDGNITVTIDSATRNQRVRVAGWQDLNNDGQIDLTTFGDINCDAFTPYDTAVDGLIAVSGRKFYTGPEGTFGVQFSGACAPIFRHSRFLQMFTAGTTSSVSNRYNYDASDIYRINGGLVTFDQFRDSITASSSGTGDTVRISYVPGGTSEFDICFNAGASAPNDLSAATGSFDGGTAANDVRITFTAPATNMVTQYELQRATTFSPATASNCTLGAMAPSGSDAAGIPAGSAFSTVQTVTLDAGKTGQALDLNRLDGGHCYRVRTQDPITGAPSFSNYTPVNTPGVADTAQPVSTAAILEVSAGFAAILDTGDRFAITFNEQMFVLTNATIRFTDSDCGAASSSGPAPCVGGQTNTVSDVTCGVNAVCALDTAKTRLTVTLTAAPAVVVPGSVPGSQLPVVVTDASGVTDLSNNIWNLGASPDRLIP